jgi:type I restriction enzyme S subunit
VLKTTAVVWDGFNCSENKALPEMLNPRLEYEIKVGDVLMTRAGPGNRVGVVAYVDSTQQMLMLSDKLYRIHPKKIIVNEYLALLLSSNSIQRQLNTTKTGLAESQSNISQDIVKKLLVAVPTNKEQDIIVRRTNTAARKIKSDQTYLNKLKVLKSGLMQDLLTGKVKG